MEPSHVAGHAGLGAAGHRKYGCHPGETGSGASPGCGHQLDLKAARQEMHAIFGVVGVGILRARLVVLHEDQRSASPLARAPPGLVAAEPMLLHPCAGGDEELVHELARVRKEQEFRRAILGRVFEGARSRYSTSMPPTANG